LLNFVGFNESFLLNDCPENCQFFHETWQFFEILETTRIKGSLFLIFLKYPEPVGL